MLQVIAQVERNDAYLMADFLTKRGQHPVVGATHSPPRDFNYDSCSAVLGCFCKTLAIAKVSLNGDSSACWIMGCSCKLMQTWLCLGICFYSAVICGPFTLSVYCNDAIIRVKHFDLSIPVLECVMLLMHALQTVHQVSACIKNCLQEM